jgi:hypothetical protein
MGRPLAVALLVACSSARDPAPELAAYLYARSGDPSVVDEWRMTRAEWNKTVVVPYTRLYDSYVQRFAAHAPGLRTQMAKKHPIVARAHVAGDEVATRDQAVTRWALPTLAPSRVAELAGSPAVPIDAVFVEVDGRWKAIVGLAEIVRAAIFELDPTCAPAIYQLDPKGGRCIEAAWAVADAALREDRPRLSHLCGLARDLCGKPPP